MKALVEARKVAIDSQFAEMCSARRAFVNLVGERYAECRFENFVTGNDKLKIAARDACRDIASNIANEIASGRSLVLAGPVGTGKDHLLACVLREVVKAGIACERVNGSDLAGHCRDLIGGHSTERDFLDRWSCVPLLAISDPDGTREKLSDFYADWLYRIVDGRYREGKAVWVTLNTNSDSDAAKKIGDRTWDRIRHGATIIRTNWRTYRTAKVVVNKEENK